MLITITTLSIVVAAAAAAVAWRLVQDNRRRSAARVAYLAEVLHEQETPDEPAVAVPHLLEQAEARSANRLLPLTVACAAVLAFGLAAWLPGRDRQAASTAATPAGERAAVPPTLDLVALTHERGAGGHLELRGEVETPLVGAKMEAMTAVALLFDRQGAYLSSTRSPLTQVTEPRGTRASFSISIPDAARVGRYRVSFRDGERVVPHVDRRQAARQEAGS